MIPYNTEAELMRQQTIAYMSPRKSHVKGFTLWLLCPQIRKTPGYIPIKKIDTFSHKRNEWLNNSKQERKLYR